MSLTLNARIQRYDCVPFGESGRKGREEEPSRCIKQNPINGMNAAINFRKYIILYENSNDIKISSKK